MLLQLGDKGLLSLFLQWNIYFTTSPSPFFHKKKNPKQNKQTTQKETLLFQAVFERKYTLYTTSQLCLKTVNSAKNQTHNRTNIFFSFA